MLAFAVLVLAQSAAAAPSPAAPRASTERLERMQKALIAMGFPPGVEMPADQSDPIGEAVIAPLFHQPFMCAEHPQGQLSGLGDALGTDCMIVGGIEGDVGYERPFRTDRRTNADWYGWHAEVHSPFDGIVRAVIANPVTNVPGRMGKPPASGIIFERADGLNVIFGHITQPRVKPGDHVTAGQVIAVDGNNGMARNPHIHVGAWKGKKALQIRWDSHSMGQVSALVDN